MLRYRYTIIKQCFYGSEEHHNYWFPNRRGESVVFGEGLHSYPFYAECAEIIEDESENGFKLVYDVSDDVVVVQGEYELQSFLRLVFSLPPYDPENRTSPTVLNDWWNREKTIVEEI